MFFKLADDTSLLQASALFTLVNAYVVKMARRSQGTSDLNSIQNIKCKLTVPKLFLLLWMLVCLQNFEVRCAFYDKWRTYVSEGATNLDFIESLIGKLIRRNCYFFKNSCRIF